MCLEGVITPVMNYVETIQGGIRNTLDSMFFAYIAIAAIIIPVLCSLYIGTEYSDGTVEEKTQINSRYLRGTERTVYEILYDFLPGGQIVQLSSAHVIDPSMDA